MIETGDLVILKIQRAKSTKGYYTHDFLNQVDISFKQRHYWDVKEGQIGIVLNDSGGLKSTHKLVYFPTSKRGAINIKEEDLEKIDA
jgi:hypothetical protein